MIQKYENISETSVFIISNIEEGSFVLRGLQMFYVLAEGVVGICILYYRWWAYRGLVRVEIEGEFSSLNATLNVTIFVKKMQSQILLVFSINLSKVKFSKSL